MGSWGKGGKYIRSDKYIRFYKDNGIGWLAGGNALNKNERLRVIDHQIKAKNESPRPFLAT